MTDRPCPLDGVPLAPDEYICRACAGALRGRLRAVPDLLDELDTTLAGQRSNWSEPGGIHGQPSGGCKPGCDHSPDSTSCSEGVALGMNLAASEAAMQLRVVLHGWARVWDEETPIAPPDPAHYRDDDEGRAALTAARYRATNARKERDRALTKSATQALLLAARPLAGRTWAPELAAEIRDAVRQAERAVDRPPDQTLAGTCTCGMAVYAEPGDRTCRCRWCGTRHDPAQLYDEAIANADADDACAPAAVIARSLIDPATGKPLCTAAQIRGWRYRGSLDPVGVNPAGQPLYAVTAVRRLAREGAATTIHGPLCETAEHSSCEHDSCRAMRPERQGQAS